MYACVCTCICVPEKVSGDLLYCSHFIPGRQGLSVELSSLFWPGWLVGESLGSAYFCFTALRLQAIPSFMWILRFKVMFVKQTCLLTEAYPQPLGQYFNFIITNAESPAFSIYKWYKLEVMLRVILEILNSFSKCWRSCFLSLVLCFYKSIKLHMHLKNTISYHTKVLNPSHAISGIAHWHC